MQRNINLQLSASQSDNIINKAHAISTELGIAVEATQIAGTIIREQYNNNISFSAKSHGDWVSQVDKDVDLKIREYLNRLSPQFDIYSEESGGIITNKRNCWIVDPLDGTSAFLFKTGIDQPSVMIALSKTNYDFHLGVVYFPLSNEIFFAEKGKGAFYNGASIHIPQTNIPLQKGHVILNHYSDSTYETIWFDQLRREIRKPGGAALVTVESPHSGIACRMLQGDRPLVAIVHDNSPYKIKQELWDIAAPRVIVEEAGGAFVNTAGYPYGIDSIGPILIARDMKIINELLMLARKAKD